MTPGPSQPPTPSRIFQIDALGSHRSYYIITIMMASVMHVSYTLVFHQSKCISAMSSVATAGFSSLDLGFFCFIWGPGVFIKNLFFFTPVKF